MVCNIEGTGPGDSGLHVGHRKGLVVTVALVDAVQLGAHTAAVCLCGAAGERQKDGYDGQQMSHGAKVQNISESYIALDTKNVKKRAKTCHDDGFIKYDQGNRTYKYRIVKSR